MAATTGSESDTASNEDPEETQSDRDFVAPEDSQPTSPATPPGGFNV